MFQRRVKNFLPRHLTLSLSFIRPALGPVRSKVTRQETKYRPFSRDTRVHAKCSSSSSPFNLYEAVKASSTVAARTFPSQTFLPYFQSSVDTDSGIERVREEAHFTGSRRAIHFTTLLIIEQRESSRRFPLCVIPRFRETAIIYRLYRDNIPRYRPLFAECSEEGSGKSANILEN